MGMLVRLLVIGLGVLMARHGSAAESVLHVRMQVAQSLAAPDQPPDLVVQVRNDGPSALPFMHFENDLCFAQFYLQLALRRPDARVDKPQLACAILSWPGSERSLTPGATLSRRLPLARLFSGPFPKGHYEVEVDWNPQALTSYFAGKYAWRADSTEHGNTGFDLLAPIETVLIEKGHTVKLSDGAQLTFHAHGHKRTRPGQVSPLIIHGAFRAPGGTQQEFSFNLFTDEDRSFFLQDRYRFALLDHQYDHSMRLAYYGAKASSKESSRARDR